MTEPLVEIQGGAGEFEAAVIAVVLDRINRDEEAAREGKARRENEISAWVRAARPERPRPPIEVIHPD